MKKITFLLITLSLLASCTTRSSQTQKTDVPTPTMQNGTTHTDTGGSTPVESTGTVGDGGSL